MTQSRALEGMSSLGWPADHDAKRHVFNDVFFITDLRK